MLEKFLKNDDEISQQKHREEMEQQVALKFLDDLQTTDLIEIFEGNVKTLTGEYKKYGVKLPENLEELRKNCLERNRVKVEAEFAGIKEYGNYKAALLGILTNIYKRLEELEK